MAAQPTTTGRGLGNTHQQRVLYLRSQHNDGDLCWWCGKPMYLDRHRNWDYNPDATRRDGLPDTTSGVLAGDHTISRSRRQGNLADRLLHGLCNKQRGDGSHDDKRPALQRSEDDVDQLGTLVFPWP